MVSTIMAPAINTIAHELNMNSAESVMALSIYLLATAFGPLIIGPLSEIYGRAPILHASNVWFLVWNIVCGFARNKETLIAARFLAGFGASAIYALAGGVLGDIWRPEQRGKSLGIYLLIPLLGAAVGMAVCRRIRSGIEYSLTSWMIRSDHWRFHGGPHDLEMVSSIGFHDVQYEPKLIHLIERMFWSTSAFQGVMIIASFVAFQEPHAPTILRRRAEKKRSGTGDQRYLTAAERTSAEVSTTQIIGRSLSRPLRLLAFHPIIQILSILSALSYGLLYIALATFSELFVTAYDQSVEISGLHYIAVALGEISGSQTGGPLMDKIFRKLQDGPDDPGRPEYHIPIMLPGAFIAPAGLLIYGWAAQSHAHWIVVDIGMFIMTFGLQVAGMPIQAYIIDAYPDHASSAAGASQFLRSLSAFTFPLFAPAMYRALGYGWGNSVLALFALLVGVPAPLILWRYGARLRARGGVSI
jgi:MFS family permease